MNIMIFQSKIKDKINIIINITKKKFILLKFISRILLITK